MKYAQVQDHPNLVRDLATGSVVNVDDAAYAAHLKRKSILKKKAEADKSREDRINKLESDVAELKSGINQILEILKHGNR